jgi:hypothetical protein
MVTNHCKGLGCAVKGCTGCAHIWQPLTMAEYKAISAVEGLIVTPEIEACILARRASREG